MTKGEQNFIESKDNLYFNLRTNCLLHGTILIFCSIDIILYLYNIDYKLFQGTFFGFIFAIVIASLDIINVLINICFQKKYQHVYYGVCLVMISLYLSYLVIKEGLHPFNQLFGFFALGIWLLSSIVLICAINDNIKNDRYNDVSESIYFFKDQGKNNSDKKYGIVITKSTFINAIIYITVAINLIIVYFINKDLFKDSGELLVDYAHCGLIITICFLSCVTNFGWKLIIKQKYLNKSNKSMTSN